MRLFAGCNTNAVRYPLAHAHIFGAIGSRPAEQCARAALANSGVMRVASLILAGVEAFRDDRVEVGRAPQSVKLNGIVYRTFFAKSSDARSGSLEFR